ncbi:MAG: nitroreductase family protein [Clostridiales bacterium]|jgi:nitroreductase|nr:nitroreductase family protein [Clostridiales bacterium]
MTVSEAIASRRSIRRFKPGAVVEKDKIQALLEAAMQAPSACNTRPWEFIVITSRDILEKIRKAHAFTNMLATASLAIVVCAIPEEQEGISLGFFPQDCAAATENILIKAVDLGLGACWCGVYPKEPLIAEVRDILSIKSIPFNVIAVGAPDEAPAPRGGFDPKKVKYVN